MYTTYDVFNDVLGMRNMIERFFRDTPSASRIKESPYINLYENEDELEIKVVVPGFKVEDLNLELVDHSLLIEGEKKSDYVEKPYIRKEREFGRFKKSVKLPFKVDANSVNAAMKDGILSVKLVKSEEAKPKKISIK